MPSSAKLSPVSSPQRPAEKPAALPPNAPASVAADEEHFHRPAPHTETAEIVLEMDKRRPVTPKGDFMAPRWSPDGLDILATKGKYRGLYLISSDGTHVRRISDAPKIGYHARWSPDGRYIVVEQDGGTLYYDRNGELVNAEDVPPQNRPPVYAEDGAIYLRSEDERSGEDQVIIADEDKYFAPVASPDGSRVAFIGLESGIVIKDLQTREDVFIGEGTSLSWMPDGSGIIYNFTQDDGKRILEGDIYFASADGGITENLTNTPGIIERRPSITADGSQLTFEADGRIFTVDVRMR